MFNNCSNGLLTCVDKMIQIGQRCVLFETEDWLSTNVVRKHEHLRIKKCMEARGRNYVYIS